MFLGLGFTSFGQTETSCDLTDSPIPKDSVLIFKDSFENIFGTNYSSVKFKHADLKKLYDNNHNTNVRMYFTYSNTALGETLPGIALVAYSKNDCNHDLKDTVITSYDRDITSSVGKMDSTISQTMEQWKNLYTHQSLSNFEKNLGYNFPWETIWSACGSDTNDLRVIFAIFENTKTRKNEIHMVLTNPTEEPVLSEIFLDFSKPCPQLCGTTVGGGSGGSRGQ